MQESSTYQQLIEEGIEKGIEKGFEKGFVDGKRDELLRQAQRKYGPVTKSVQKALNSITDAAQIEHLMDEIVHAKNWSDLLRTVQQSN